MSIGPLTSALHASLCPPGTSSQERQAEAQILRRPCCEPSQGDEEVEIISALIPVCPKGFNPLTGDSIASSLLRERSRHALGAVRTPTTPMANRNRRGWGLVSDLQSVRSVPESSVMDTRSRGPLHGKVAPPFGLLRMITNRWPGRCLPRGLSSGLSFVPVRERSRLVRHAGPRPVH
jgi:hypothetical protein